MNLAYTKQKFQDWFTQQWVIIWGKRITPSEVPWLMGPFGNKGPIADQFITELAQKEGLTINRNASSQGLIPSIKTLNLSDSEQNRLSKQVASFYESTSNYKFSFSVNWNPFFRIFGILVQKLFSTRLKQLNIPTKNIKDSKDVESEIITLTVPESNEVKYTIWFRTFKSTGQVLFAGVYSVCTLDCGKKCVKATFPLPQGNATVIMSPKVGHNGELILSSAGKKFGDPGFYFVLTDSKGNLWSRRHQSFRDKLIVSANDESILTEHTQTLWHLKVLKFTYRINSRNLAP